MWTILYQGDPKYDEARLVSNYYPSKNKYPAAIVYCLSKEDVQKAVNLAREKGQSIRIRSGGHNHEGFSTGNDVLIIDVSLMKEVHIDKNKLECTLQPGITGGELYKKLFTEGLTQVGGTCADVGLSGLVLTGGMGPLLRKVGLTCDTLLAIELVDAKGNFITATKDNEHKDLFWACCGGGGGNFGVVTSLKLKVVPATQVTWFNLGWDWEQPVEEIINTWQTFFAKDDRRWFSHLDLWSKAFKYEKQPIKVLGVFYGPPEEARKELAPFLQIGKLKDQTIEQVEWKKAIQAFEEATTVFITDKPEYKSTGAFAKQKLPPEAVHTIVQALKETQYPLFNVLLFSLGGKCAEVDPHATAYYYRKSPYFLCYSVQWLQASEDKAATAELDRLRTKLLPYADGDYVGNPDRNLPDFMSTYYGENAARLKQVKQKYDPDNLFRHEQSVPLN